MYNLGKSFFSIEVLRNLGVYGFAEVVLDISIKTTTIFSNLLFQSPRESLILTLNVWSIGLVCFDGFYGISTFVGYLTPNPFLCE